MHPVLEDLTRQFDAADRDAADLIASLTPERAAWKPAPGRWSVLGCIEHIGTSARWYLTKAEPAIEKGRARGVLGQGPYRYGWLESYVIRNIEPPYKLRTKTGPMYQPKSPADPATVLAGMVAAHDAVRAAIRRSDGLDLGRIRFLHPHLFFLRYSLGGCFATLAGHARRHLWQARQTAAIATQQHLP